MITLEQLQQYKELDSIIYDWIESNYIQYREDCGDTRKRLGESVTDWSIDLTNETIDVRTSSRGCNRGCCGIEYDLYEIPFRYIFDESYQEEFRAKKLAEIEQAEKDRKAKELANEKLRLETNIKMDAEKLQKLIQQNI